jgi:ubiquinol-cytochrome c reductase cytochrome b subunit
MPFWTKREAVKIEPDRITMNGGMGGWKALGVWIVVALLVFLPLKAVGSDGKACGAIDCDPIAIDLTDKASLQNGAKLFANYCMGCHSAAFSRWERVADDLGMPHALVEQNLIFGDQKKGDLMTISMSQELGKQFFGATPPDLSLSARARSPEWLYTYLRNFYKDESRPMGVNNRVFKDVGMPHVLLELQGLQECALGPVVEHGSIKEDPLTGEPLLTDPCGSYDLSEKGSLSPEKYDDAVYDLVNFMTYVGEPGAERRKNTGVYVLFFLAFLFVFVCLVNREYWKEIH